MEEYVKLEFKQEEIHKVNKFKYLGSILEADGSTGRKIIGILNSVLWSKNTVTIRVIYNSLVQSLMLCGAETQTLDRAHASKLLATEMDFWRRAARKSSLGEIVNQRIREMMKVNKNILEVIKERKLRWYGHIKRMGENRIPKIILEWNAEDKEKRKTTGKMDGWNQEEYDQTGIDVRR